MRFAPLPTPPSSQRRPRSSRQLIAPGVFEPCAFLVRRVVVRPLGSVEQLDLMVHERARTLRSAALAVGITSLGWARLRTTRVYSLRPRRRPSYSHVCAPAMSG